MAQDCPTADHLAAGIEIEIDDGTVEISRALTPSVVRTVGSYPVEDGTEGYVVDLAQGLYILMYISGPESAMDVNTRSTYAFEMPPEEMPPVTPGAVMSLPVVGVDLGNGPEPYADTHIVSVGQPYDLTIGGCSYSALEVLYEYATDPDGREGYVYFPELGISYFAWWESADAERETYTPVRIGIAQ